jgi:hypothetical protein
MRPWLCMRFGSVSGERFPGKVVSTRDAGKRNGVTIWQKAAQNSEK